MASDSEDSEMKIDDDDIEPHLDVPDAEKIFTSCSGIDDDDSEPHLDVSDTDNIFTSSTGINVDDINQHSCQKPLYSVRISDLLVKTLAKQFLATELFSYID